MSELHGLAVSDTAIAPILPGQDLALLRLHAPRLFHGDVNQRGSTVPLRFPVWERVVLGRCSNTDGYRRVLQEAGRTFDTWTRELFRRESFPCASTEKVLDLALVTPRLAGFEEGARYGDFCARILRGGLTLCPAEVGPALRLQCGGKFNSDWIGIGMAPIEGWNALSFIFALARRGQGEELQLCGYYSHPDYFWNADHPFVFVLK